MRRKRTKTVSDHVAEIVGKMIERLKALPDGTVTTTSRFANELGYCIGDWDPTLFDIHEELLERAEKENIYLDLSSHEGGAEELPFNLTFMVWHDRKTWWYCGVAFPGDPDVYAYISDGGEVEAGSYVEVPFGGEGRTRIGEVVSCLPRMEENAPSPVGETQHITRAATEEEFLAQGGGAIPNQILRRQPQTEEAPVIRVAEEPAEEEIAADQIISPIPFLSKYFELIFAKDVLWENFRLYVRETFPDREEEFFAYHRDPELIEVWRQAFHIGGDGLPATLFAAAAFLLYAYRDQGHDLDAELAGLHTGT